MPDWTHLLYVIGCLVFGVACIALGYKAGLRRSSKREVANTLASYMNERLLKRIRDLEAGVAFSIDTLETITSTVSPDEPVLPQDKLDLAETTLIRLHRIRFPQ